MVGALHLPVLVFGPILSQQSVGSLVEATSSMITTRAAINASCSNSDKQ